MGTEIQQNRYDQLLRRVGGLIGPGAKVAEVLAELFPVLDVENVPGELLLLGGMRIAMGGGTFTSIAAQSPRIQLFNPVDSASIITLTRLTASTTSNDTVRFGPVTVPLTSGIGTETYRDLRLALAQRPVGEIRQESSVAFADGTGQSNVLAQTPYLLEDENGVCVLPPGSGFEIGITARLAPITTMWFWRERNAEASELNL